MIELVIAIVAIALILLYLVVEKLSCKSNKEKFRSEKKMHEEKNELQNKVLEFEKVTGYKIDDFLGESPKVKAEETFIGKLAREDNEAFNKWFDRWYKKQDLKSKIIDSNLKGKRSFLIVIEEKEDLYLKRRLLDARTTQRISEKLYGINVELVNQESRYYIWLGSQNDLDNPYIHIYW